MIQVLMTEDEARDIVLGLEAAHDWATEGQAPKAVPGSAAAAIAQRRLELARQIDRQRVD